MIKYSYAEFIDNWTSTTVNDKEKGVAMFIETTPDFYEKAEVVDNNTRSYKFLMHYISVYKNFCTDYLGAVAWLFASAHHAFLTQAIVDIGIKYDDIGFIWLVLLGELMIVTGRTATDFIRRWLLLHISIRINISLVSDFLSSC